MTDRIDHYSRGQRNVKYRFDVIRNGVKYDELLATNTPSIEMVYNGEIKTSLSGSFKINDQVNYLTDYIRPMMWINGVWYPLGEYITATAPDKYDTIGTVDIKAYDRALFLQQATTIKRIMFHKGNRYLDVIQAILIENGVSKIADPDANADVLQTDREDWEIGTPYITIINQLLSEINFNSLWFDFDGYARLTKYIPPNQAEINHVYENDRRSVLYPEWSKTTDLYEAYNVFVKVVSSPDYPEPMVARAVNNDPNSPISTVQRGRQIVDPDTEIDNIASQTALQEYVNNLMERSKLSTEEVSFQTANLPTHKIRDVISLKYSNFSGLVSETRWVMNLRYDGSMTHEGKVINL